MRRIPASLMVAEGAIARAPYFLTSKRIEWWNTDDHGSARMTDDGAGLISAWQGRDLGITLTGSGSARPTWAGKSANGYSGITFDGVANTLRSTVLTGLPTGAAGAYWFMSLVQLTPGTTGTVQMLDFGGTTAGTHQRLNHAASGSVSRAQVQDGTTGLTSGATQPFDGPHVVVGFWLGTTEKGWLDNVAFSTASATITNLNTGTTRLALGSNNSTTAAGFSAFCVHEIFCMRSDLTDFERSILTQYMMRGIAATDALPTSYTSVGPKQTFYVTSRSTLPYKNDWRTSVDNQVRVSSTAGDWIYNSAGVLVPKGATELAAIAHDPVTHEPYGLQNFTSVTQYGLNRSTPAAQNVALTLSGNYCAYLFGRGATMRLQGGPIDVTVQGVDPNLDGYQSQPGIFSITSGVTLAVSFTGTPTFFQIEKAKSPTPPMLTGQRRLRLYSYPIEAMGLPSAIDRLTCVLLMRSSDTDTGSTFLQLDDNVLPAGQVNSRYKYVWNALPNPNVALPSKNGQAGITIDVGGDPKGVDPTDFVMVEDAWRCFATTFDAPSGVIRVAMNGGIEREEDFDPTDFPTDPRLVMARLMTQVAGAPLDGWQAGVYLSRDLLSPGGCSQISATGQLFTY